MEDRGRWTVGVEGGYGLWQVMRTRVDRGERVGVEEECRYGEGEGGRGTKSTGGRGSVH